MTLIFRARLLKLLAEHENIRPRSLVITAISKASSLRFLISYTINLIPSEAEQAALKAYVESGKNGCSPRHQFDCRIHGCGCACPRLRQFYGNIGLTVYGPPTNSAFHCQPTSPDHPLVKGISSFKTTDELYRQTLVNSGADAHNFTEKPQALFMQTGPMMNQDRLLHQ